MANALFTVNTVEGGPVILLEDVIVAGPYRGRGIRRQLFDHVLRWARANGFLRITLLTDGDNTRRLALLRTPRFNASTAHRRH